MNIECPAIRLLHVQKARGGAYELPRHAKRSAVLAMGRMVEVSPLGLTLFSAG
jgi:hypothetical protein